MFRSNSPFGNDISSYAGSIKSNGYSTMDEVWSLASDVSRPSAKSIYLQRKEYAESINKMMEKFHYRVEHLFTCTLDKKELRSVADCVQRLKLLDGMGHVWAQSMLLEVRGANLLFTDIETKEELESIPLSDVLELKAVLDPGLINSLLTVSALLGRKQTPTVFMFQCEDVRADLVERDFARTLARSSSKSSEPSDQRPAFESVPQWSPPDYEKDDYIVPEPVVPQEEERAPSPQPLSTPRPYTELDRNVDILNHIVVSHCPEGLPQNIVAPLLTPQCIRLMSEEASTEEDQLWQSLGDAWNIPSTKWPEDDEDIPVYTLEFSDGWQPPEVSASPEPMTHVSKQERPYTPEWKQERPYTPEMRQERPYTPERKQEIPKPARVQTPPKWSPANPPQPRAKSMGPMRVVYDFNSRNQRELTVSKGEIVELLDKTKQWWKVRNDRGEEGFVPNNVLEVPGEPSMEFSQHDDGPPVLTRKSKAAEVRAWLEDKEFSKITVRCLGGLSGAMLLGMSREELKKVCPEEGGRVFFQLQAVKSAMVNI